MSLLLTICLLTALADAKPLLHVEKPTFNFGECDSAGIVTNVFILRNQGDSALQIIETKESCGCTVSEITAKTVEPGEAAELAIRLNLKGMAGPVKKSVHIISNDPKRVHSVTMEGTALARIALQPPSLSLGRINPRQPPAPVQVRLGGYFTNAVITDIVCSTNIFKVVKTEGSRSITVHPPTNTSPGALKQSVIVATSDKKSPKLTLGIFAYIAPPIRYTPRTITVPVKAENFSRWVMLKPGTIGDFTLIEAKLSSPFASVKIHPGPLSSFNVILSEFNADLITENSTLTLITDNPEQLQIVVPVQMTRE